MRINDAGEGAIWLGRQGENLATRIRFDTSKITDAFGTGGTFTLLARRRTDPGPYPVEITVEDDRVIWDVTEADTAIDGAGQCELRYYQGDVLVKTMVWTTKVSRCIEGDGIEPPEPYETWVEQVLNAAESAAESAAAAEAALEAMDVDPTLTIEDSPADAMATGNAVAQVASQLAEIAAGYNLVDNTRFLENTGWAYDSEQEAYYGAINKLYAATTLFRGISGTYKPGTQYTISFQAKIAAAAGTGNGLRAYAKYTDETTGASITVKRNATAWATYTATTDAGKSLNSFTITYSSGGTDVYYIRNLTVRERISTGTATAIDREARARMPLQPSGDTTDRAAEILSRLTAYGHCELAAGEFYISSIDMPPDAKLSGMGNTTRLIKLGADIDANAVYLTSDLAGISGITWTPLGYVGTAAQYNGALTPRTAYATAAGTSYRIRIRAQRVGGTPVNESGLSVVVAYHLTGGESQTAYIAPNTFMRDGALVHFSYTTDSSWIIDSIRLTYYNGGADTWRISEFTIASEADAAGTGTIGYAIKAAHRCMLTDFMLLGAEAAITPVETPVAYPPANAGRDGILLQGPGSYDDGRRYYLLQNLFIANFSDSGIKAYDTGYPTTSGALITDVTVRNCGTGVQLNGYAEYFNVTGLRAHYCVVGVMVTGGNNFFANCNISSNQVNILMDNSSGAMNNNSHGGFVGCTVNHSRGPNGESDGGVVLRVIKMTSGEVFSNCSFLGGGRVEITNSYGIAFSGCQMWNMKEGITDVYFTCTGTGSSSVKCSVLFIGCVFRHLENLKYRQIGTPNVFFQSCLDAFRGILINEPPTPVNE